MKVVGFIPIITKIFKVQTNKEHWKTWKVCKLISVCNERKQDIQNQNIIWLVGSLGEIIAPNQYKQQPKKYYILNLGYSSLG